MISFIVAMGLTAGWGCLIGGSGVRRLLPELMKNRKASPVSWRVHMMEAPFLKAVEYAAQWETAGLLLNGYHTRLVILRGASWTMDRTKLEAAAGVGMGYLAMVCCAWLAAMSGEEALLAAGALASVGLALRGYADAGKAVKERKHAIMVALPDRMSKLMLLVGAGETVQGAFLRCLEGKESSQHPLDREWRAAVAGIRNGQPFNEALERFNRSCAVQEASLFTTVMLLNYRKGGEQFVLSVRELSYSLWEKRKEAARLKGEEASSKLVFPLVGILFILMILVAAPAVLMLS
ncbi:type II secretion system F family protein [Paenibacillus sp. PL2-23]|uniref:type II secretion system F family protein n=1 Tax=Paenibacillus sp. PL2-23 TaxID=2100729 RepID=UPI0030F89C3C